MNHFLLPGDGPGDGATAMRGVNAMELLINGLLKIGARRDRLQAKIFGGARMIKGLSDIGNKNASFATEFLQQESIECVGQCLGGNRARRIRFLATEGRVKQRLLGQSRNKSMRSQPQNPQLPPKDQATSNFSKVMCAVFHSCTYPSRERLPPPWPVKNEGRIFMVGATRFELVTPAVLKAVLYH